MVGTAMLVAAGVSAAASAISAHKQAGAAKDAAKIQVDASNQAAQRSLGATQDALNYIDQARNAPAPMSPFPAYNNLMGQNRPVQPSMPGVQGPGMGQIRPQPVGYQGLMSAPGPQMSGLSPQGAMVTLQAPDGSTKQVPEADAAKYPWAKRVG